VKEREGIPYSIYTCVRRCRTSFAYYIHIYIYMFFLFFLSFSFFIIFFFFVLLSSPLSCDTIESTTDLDD